MRKRLRAASMAALLWLAVFGAPPAAGQESSARAREEAQREAWQNVPKIVEALGIGPGSVVADIGAGGGFFTVRLSRAVGSTGRVYAVDVTTAVVEQLRKRVAEEALSNVVVLEGSAWDPRLASGTLDAALIVNSYHEMPEHQAMLTNLRKALKPDGRLVIVEPISASRRDLPRDEQVRNHEIGAEHVEQDARGAGFRVVRLEDPFLTRGGQGPEGDDEEWLLMLRPAAAPAAASNAAGASESKRQPPAGDEDAAAEWKSPALRIAVDEFKRLHGKGAVVVLDVRDPESYRDGHLPGAILMPLDTVESRAVELRREKKPIVTYCS